MQSKSSILKHKIDLFQKKYYIRKVLMGLVLSFIILLIISLLIIFIEYFSFLQPKSKLILLISYIVLFITIISIFVINPLLKLLRVKRGLNIIHINKIVVEHFTEIKDTLLNVHELQEKDHFQNTSEELLNASIDQKISDLEKYSFKDAINFKLVIKYSIIAFLFFILFTLLFIFNNNLVIHPIQRLYHINTVYEKPSPYSVNIVSDLKVAKGKSINIAIEIISKKNFEDVFIKYGNNTYKFKNDSLNFYFYEFQIVNNDIDFQVIIDNYETKKYKIVVLPQPILSSFTILINKPNYTNQNDDTFENITTLTVPNGSYFNIDFKTHYTDTIIISNENIIKQLTKENFQYSGIVKSDQILNVSIKNQFFTVDNVVNIDFKTINDNYPTISVIQLADSIDFTSIYFKGNIEDDYGFNKLNFITRVNNQIDSVFVVEINKSVSPQSFYYAYSFNNYKNIDQRIDYYFEIFDNDILNGYKSTVSDLFSFNFPKTKELFEFQDEEMENIEDLLKNSMSLTNEIKNDLEDLKFKLLNDNLTDWQKKETVKNIYSKKQNLEDILNSIRERNEELNNYMQSFTEQNSEILEKQEQIQQMLDEVMSEELKKLMDELNKMMEQMNDNLMEQLKEQIDISLDDLSKQLDKNLEILKKMKIEQQLNQIVDKIETLKEKQDELIENIDNNADLSEIADEQENIKNDLKDLKEQYQDINDENSELDDMLPLLDFNNEFNELEKEINQSIDNQKKNNKSKSKKSMQNNSQSMENLAFMMQQMIDSAFEEANAENLEDLLQILDNLIIFSHNQEKLITTPNTIEYQYEILKDQKKLFNDFSIIKDSLYALSRREPSINTVVNKEIVSIENQFLNTDKQLTEGRVQQGKMHQQMILTSVNNLALFMSEAIKNMQQQMANSMPGNQNCQKPGNNPNPNSMSNSLKQMQKSLQSQLEKMLENMRKGEQGTPMNGEMGKALAEQEKMKNMLQQMMNQGNVGSGAYETLKEAEQLLDKVREDIIRNNLSDNTINRQQQILTRLLEAETAQNERELDEKRKSESAEQQRVSETAKFFDNLNSNDKFEERLIRDKLKLNKFYQYKFQNYVNQLDSISGKNY